ncbi:Glycoside hydrolase [Theobroma cacao]|nr:Glycoside hydrolase [Theobroma cacao]
MKNLGFLGSCSTCTITVFICILMCSNVVVHAEGFHFDSRLLLPRSGSARTGPRAKRVLSVHDFGAKGDAHHNDTKAFQNAWKMACSFPARTRILIPAGYTYLIHPVELGGPCESKVTLMISGTIVAPKDPDVWDGLNPRKWLYFHGVNHLHVDGGGTINGMGQEWWARSCKRKKTNVLPCRHAPTVRPAFLFEK